ncbi:hypothetical protein ABK040_011545 [Willaertia magna]
MQQVKKRKIDALCYTIDNLSLRNIFTYSSIIDIISSFQFVNKQWYNILKSEEFQKSYYGNIFKLNDLELNNLNKTLSDLNYLKGEEMKCQHLLHSFTKVPSNFEYLFKLYCNLQFYVNKNNLEEAKLYLFNHFNKNTNKKGKLYCSNIENNKNKNYFEHNDFNKLFNLFNLSKFTINHIYPLIYEYEEKENDDDEIFINSNVIFILYLDNGIPLLISNTFNEFNGETFKIEINIDNKLLFNFTNEELKIDFNLLNDLINDKLFNKEEINNLINKYNYKLTKDTEISKFNEDNLQSFIVKYLFYLFNIVHKDFDKTSFSDVISAIEEGEEISLLNFWK